MFLTRPLSILCLLAATLAAQPQPKGQANEIYQVRNFAADRVHVLLELDTSSVDMNAPGMNPGAKAFPLAWTKSYGAGRVFYNALGHFDSTWEDPGIRKMMLEAMLWLTGQDR
jgi:type 1 glutamine amidotransferase